MKLERLLNQVEAQLTRATNENDGLAVLRLYTLLAMLRKERIAELERQISKQHQQQLKLKLAK